MVAYLSRDIRNDDMDSALRRLQTFLSTIPYCDNTRYEGHYQQMFYIIFSLLGSFVDVEVRTPPWSSGCGASYENNALCDGIEA